MRFLELSAVRPYSLQQKESNFSTMAAVSIAIFREPGSSGYRTFVVLAQACLFVCLLFVLYLVFYEHVFCCITTFASQGPFRDPTRRNGGRTLLSLLRFGSHILFYRVSMTFLFYHALVDTAARLRGGTGSYALSSGIFVRTYFFLLFLF